MKKIAQFFLKPTIPVVTINGQITAKSVIELEKNLKEIRVSTAKALAVVVNSPGGSPTQSKKMVDLIHNFAHDNHLTVYTFAEDLAASAGFQVLISGDKVFADLQSTLGSIGSVTNFMNAKELILNQGIDIRSLSTNPASVSNQSILNDTPQELRRVYEDILQSQHKKFIDLVEEQRGQKIKIPKEKRGDLLYNGDVFNGKQALEYGLIDSIGRVQDVMKEEFPKAEVVFPQKPSITGKFMEYAKLYNIFQTIYQK
ncbi:hypothetical protein ABPG72_001936 [Tetrahymena utriculariae]